MEIRQQCAHHSKLKSRINKQVSLTAPRLYESGIPGRVFQRTHGCCPNRHYPSLLIQRTINLFYRFSRNAVRLAMQLMFFHLLHAHRLKSPQPDVQRDLGSLDPALLQARKNLRREMKSGRGCSNRSSLAGVHRLISLPVARSIFPGNIWRQWNMPKPLQLSPEIRHRLEADAALAKAPTANDFRDKVPILPKKQPFPNSDFSPRTHQALPFIPRDLLGQQHLDTAFQEVAGCRIVRTERLSPRSASPPVESGRQHARVIENDQIARPEQLRKLPEAEVLDLTGAPRKSQHSRHFPLRKRLLGNPLFWQQIVEFRYQHTVIIEIRLAHYTCIRKN